MDELLEGLNLFDRINLSHCAAKRASLYVRDDERFINEAFTARSWNNYKCVITKLYQYVDND